MLTIITTAAISIGILLGAIGITCLIIAIIYMAYIGPEDIEMYEKEQGEYLPNTFLIHSINWYGFKHRNLRGIQELRESFIQLNCISTEPTSQTLSEINELKSLLHLYHTYRNHFDLSVYEYDRLCELLGLAKYNVSINQITAE